MINISGRGVITIIALLLISLSNQSSGVEFPREALVKNSDSNIRLKTNTLADTKSLSSNSFDFAAPSEKDPATAFVIAFFPGFVVHGLGHYYIDRKATGTRLLAAEAVSVFLIYWAAIADLATLENGGKKGNINALKAVSFSLFFGSWAYDFIGAPAKVKKSRAR